MPIESVKSSLQLPFRRKISMDIYSGSPKQEIEDIGYQWIFLLLNVRFFSDIVRGNPGLTLRGGV